MFYFTILPLPFSFFIFIHHQQQTPRQFIDRIFAAGFKTAILQPLAGQADLGDFFVVVQDGIDGVFVGFHKIEPPLNEYERISLRLALRGKGVYGKMK